MTHWMVFIFHFSWAFVMCSFLWAGLRSRQGQGAVLEVMDKDTLSIKKITRAPSWVIKGLVSGFSCVVCIVYRVFSTEKHRHSAFGLGGKTRELGLTSLRVYCLLPAVSHSVPENTFLLNFKM